MLSPKVVLPPSVCLAVVRLALIFPEADICPSEPLVAMFPKVRGDTSLVVHQNVLEKMFRMINEELNFSSFYSLEEYIKKYAVCSYNTVLKFIHSINVQIGLLKSHNKCIATLSISDLWIVDDKFFVFMGNESLPRLGILNFDNCLMLTQLSEKFEDDAYTAPELLVDLDGVKLNHNVVNYSLGKIILVMLFGKKAGGKKLTYDDCKNIMNPIINTKVYFYVLRCIDTNHELRANLYI